MQNNQNQNNQPKKRTSFFKKKKLMYKSLNIKNWGIDFDKNEYKEIILSNSNHPEIMR